MSVNTYAACEHVLKIPPEERSGNDLATLFEALGRASSLVDLATPVRHEALRGAVVERYAQGATIGTSKKWLVLLTGRIACVRQHAVAAVAQSQAAEQSHDDQSSGGCDNHLPAGNEPLEGDSATSVVAAHDVGGPSKGLVVLPGQTLGTLSNQEPIPATSASLTSVKAIAAEPCVVVAICRYACRRLVLAHLAGLLRNVLPGDVALAPGHALLPRFRCVSLFSGQLLLEEGKVARGVTLVAEGSCLVHKRLRQNGSGEDDMVAILSERGGGELCGVLSVTGASPSRTTIVIRDDHAVPLGGRGYYIDAEELMRLFPAHRTVLMNLARREEWCESILMKRYKDKQVKTLQAPQLPRQRGRFLGSSPSSPPAPEGGGRDNGDMPSSSTGHTGGGFSPEKKDRAVRTWSTRQVTALLLNRAPPARPPALSPIPCAAPPTPSSRIRKHRPPPRSAGGDEEERLEDAALSLPLPSSTQPTLEDVDTLMERLEDREKAVEDELAALTQQLAVRRTEPHHQQNSPGPLRRGGGRRGSNDAKVLGDGQVLMPSMSHSHDWFSNLPGVPGSGAVWDASGLHSAANRPVDSTAEAEDAVKPMTRQEKLVQMALRRGSGKRNRDGDTGEQVSNDPDPHDEGDAYVQRISMLVPRIRKTSTLRAASASSIALEWNLHHDTRLLPPEFEVVGYRVKAEMVEEVDVLGGLGRDEVYANTNSQMKEGVNGTTSAETFQIVDVGVESRHATICGLVPDTFYSLKVAVRVRSKMHDKELVARSTLSAPKGGEVLDHHRRRQRRQHPAPERRALDALGIVGQYQEDMMYARTMAFEKSDPGKIKIYPKR